MIGNHSYNNSKIFESEKVHAFPYYDVKSIFMIAIWVEIEMSSFAITRRLQVIKFDSVKHRFLLVKMSSFGLGLSAPNLQIKQDD